MSTRSSLVKFVIFVVATLLATGTLAATIANTQFGDKATYRGVFQDVTGLAAGQEVRIAGVRVGEVKSIAVASDRVHADGRVQRAQDQRPHPGHQGHHQVPQPRR